MRTKKKQFLRDVFTNIIAVAIPIAILQLLILPKVASIKGDEEYGLIVTIISLMLLFGDSFGNVLNNVRLLQDNKYKEKGDFNSIALIGMVFNLIVVIIGCSYYGLNTTQYVGILIASTLVLSKAYYIVAFRLALSYKRILINNILVAFGYWIGFVCFKETGNWAWIYILGNGISLIHLFFSSDLMREPIKKTCFFNETLKKSVVLYIADILKTFTTYADKLLIYPILGASAVAYYYAASVMGKMLSMGISPINSVILSYVVKEKEMSKHTIKRLLCALTILAVIGFVAAYIVGRILLQLLYGSWFDVTITLLPWTVLAALFASVASVIHPFVLRFKSEFYQIFVNFVYIVIYIICSVLLSRQYGIMGFCIGSCITAFIRLVIYVVLLHSIDNAKGNMKGK